MDHIGVMRPITKYADAVYQTHRIPEYIELAIRHAVSGIPGPSYLEIPMDIFMGQCRGGGPGADSARSAPRRRGLAGPREVRQAIEILRPQAPDADGRHQRQVVARELGEMNRFIGETHIPTYTNGMGRGTVPPDSPEFLNRSRRDALEKGRSTASSWPARSSTSACASARRSPPTRRSSSSTWTRR